MFTAITGMICFWLGSYAGAWLAMRVNAKDFKDLTEKLEEWADKTEIK